MTDEESKRLARLDQWLFEHEDGAKSRAQKIDLALSVVAAGSIGGRFLLWVTGAAIMLISFWGAIKGIFLR